MTDVDRVAPEELVEERARLLEELELIVCCYPDGSAEIGRDEVANVAERAAQYITRLEGENERLRTWQTEAVIALQAATVIAERERVMLNYSNHDRLIRTALSHSAPKEGT